MKVSTAVGLAAWLLCGEPSLAQQLNFITRNPTVDAYEQGQMRATQQMLMELEIERRLLENQRQMLDLEARARIGSGTGSNPKNHYVRPHVTRKGQFVRGHHQTNPNGTTRDNYGTKPNYNPYTGKTGTR